MTSVAKSHRVMSRTDVPIIDLGPLRSGDDATRKRVGREIIDVCQGIGFFYIVNHGVPEVMIRGMFDEAKKFFDLPDEAKMRVAMTLSREYCGYLPMKMIGDDPNFKGNIHESFHTWNQEGRGARLRGPNLWPTEMPELADTVAAYFRTLHQLGFDMVDAVTMGLGLPRGTFLDSFTKPATLLRFLHYPPQEPSETEGRFGVRPHTDNGAFTILAQDETGGLEILDQNQEWVGVPPVPNSFVINLGEMMKIWTDGTFMATPHRVINRYGKERYSIPFFLNPDFDAVIVPKIRASSNKYEPVFHTTIDRTKPITCGEILLQLYKRIWPTADVNQIT